MNGSILFRLLPMLQFVAPGAVVRNRQLDQRPKRRRMIELPEMTKLMHDEIVGKTRRQECQLVAEIEITLARATPPAGALVADAHAVVGEEVAGLGAIGTGRGGRVW